MMFFNKVTNLIFTTGGTLIDCVYVFSHSEGRRHIFPHALSVTLIDVVYDGDGHMIRYLGPSSNNHGKTPPTADVAQKFHHKGVRK